MALAAAAYLHILTANFYLNLTFAIWPALIGASRLPAPNHFGSRRSLPDEFLQPSLAVASLPVIGAGLCLRRAQLATSIPHVIVLVVGILLVITFADVSGNAASLHSLRDTLPLYLASLLHFDAGEFIPNDLPIIIILTGFAAGHQIRFNAGHRHPFRKLVPCLC